MCRYAGNSQIISTILCRILTPNFTQFLQSMFKATTPVHSHHSVSYIYLTSLVFTICTVTYQIFLDMSCVDILVEIRREMYNDWCSWFDVMCVLHCRCSGNWQLLDVILWSSGVPNFTRFCQAIWTVRVGNNLRPEVLCDNSRFSRNSSLLDILIEIIAWKLEEQFIYQHSVTDNSNSLTDGRTDGRTCVASA
jgi:hypothetical protein